MSHPLAGLLVPELWWDAKAGFAHLDALIEDALELGVGGFLIANGPAEAVAELTRELRRRSGEAPLLAAEAEAGAGTAFPGLTPIPPLGALGALHDAVAFRRAATLTARELQSIGVNWALAPVADLAERGANPFVGARAAGPDAQRVAEWLVEWIDTCQGEGVLACARDFPGVGRATVDPWRDAPVVDADAATLWADDLIPFRGAVDAGVASVIAAPVAFPGMDRSGTPASQSRPLLTEFLRTELRFDGLIVSDRLAMPGSTRGAPEGAAAVAAVRAGCDLLLAPEDLGGVLEALEAVNDAGALDLDALEASRRRRRFWASWAQPRTRREPTLDDVLWARQVADTVVHPVRGLVPEVGPVVEVVVVDDGGGSRWGAPTTAPFHATLRALGLDVRLVDAPSPEGRGAVVIAVHGGPAPGRGAASLSETAVARIEAIAAAARAAHRTPLAVCFAPPAVAAGVPPAVAHVVCAWSADRAMQEGAARRLV